MTIDWNFINTSINMTPHYDAFNNFANNTIYSAIQVYAPWFGGAFGFAGFLFSALGIAVFLHSGRSTILIVSMITMIASIFYNIIATPVLAVFLIIWALLCALIVFRAFVRSG